MPRDSNGNYTLPSGVNPVVVGTTIAASWANPTMTDLAQGITDSLDRSGRGGMLAAFRFTDGTAAAPSMSFQNETTTGLFRQGSSAVGMSLAGVEKVRFTATGLDLLTNPANADDNTKAASTAFVHNIIPLGVIVMWSGSVASIPSGWALCNGTAGTPDLRDKFIVGASQDSVGVAKTNITGALTQTGGAKDATLPTHTHTASLSGTTSTQSADHSHSGTTSNDGGHSHSYSGLPWGSAAGGTSGNIWTFTNTAMTPLVLDTQGSHTHTLTTGGVSASHTHTVTTTGTSDASGSSGTNANLVPYYALCLIMKTTG